MKRTINNILLVSVNIILPLLGIIILYFTSLFWMGSKGHDGFALAIVK